jgi:murein DD-endopeptidase MepM/ murein hydrolase activator NlpD
LIPFVKDGYFITLFAWKLDINKFKTTYVVAYDKANNKNKLKIPLFITDRQIKIDDIKINEKFVKIVSKKVLQKSHMTVPKDLIKRFIKQNKNLRAENIATIREQVRENMDKNKIQSFHIKPFKRLDKSIKTAGFAERRHYYFKHEKINEAWHLGLDWASIKNAPIFASNKGKVIYDDYLGIYGNSVIIDHTLGLASIYSHTSHRFISLHDDVFSGQKIALTGETGAVLGDHLHFGVLVQGIEVDPNEWTNTKWIQTMILDTIQKAKEMIQDETKNDK